MKEYMKPEVEVVEFATENVTDVSQGVTGGESGDDF